MYPKVHIIKLVWLQKMDSVRKAHHKWQSPLGKILFAQTLWMWSYRKCSDLFYSSANNFLTSVPCFWERGCLNSGRMSKGLWEEGGRKDGERREGGAFTNLWKRHSKCGRKFRAKTPFYTRFRLHAKEKGRSSGNENVMPVESGKEFDERSEVSSSILQSSVSYAIIFEKAKLKEKEVFCSSGQRWEEYIQLVVIN